jgi:hypothetical protein
MGQARDKGRQIKESIGLWVVGFFDLMGFKRELTALNPSPIGATDAEKLALYRNLQNAVTRRRTLTKAPTLVYGAARERLATGEIPPSVDSEERLTRLRTVDLKPTGFSDSLFLEGRLDTEQISAATELHNVFNFAITSMVTHLGFLDSPLRGGIDIGWGFKDEEDQLYSPATVCAVSLEKKARHPGILVSERCRDYVLKLSDGDDEQDRMNAGAIIDVLRPNPEVQGTFFLDYLGDTARRQFLARLSSDRVRRIWLFALRSRDEFKAAGEKALIAYYERLIEYIQPNLRSWGVVP